MAKYLIQGSYVGKGVQGLLDEGGSARREEAEKLVNSVGGTLEAFYFAFGDLYAIVDVPDHATATAVSLTVNASGAATARTTVLMTPEEVDRAAKIAPDYRPPGQ